MFRVSTQVDNNRLLPHSSLISSCEKVVYHLGEKGHHQHFYIIQERKQVFLQKEYCHSRFFPGSSKDDDRVQQVTVLLKEKQSKIFKHWVIL